jgi:phosphomethylpyrimidine synthase
MFELALDPEKAIEYRNSSQPIDEEVCTMCGDLCALKRSNEILQQ